MKPQVVASVLNELAAPDAIITGDSGTNTTWIARNFSIKQHQTFSCSGNLATMAPGLPYAIGAQVAYPGRQVIAFVGDGAFTMLMGEMITAVKYQLPIKTSGEFCRLVQFPLQRKTQGLACLNPGTQK
jgi:pyruvate dehydrogenase (quinone)